VNRAAFYAYLRRRDSGVFGTSLSKKQVDGIEAILNEGGRLPLSWLAYALGTAYGETGGRMQPITENMNYRADRIRQVFRPARLKGRTPEQLAGKPELLANVVYSDMLGNGNIASGDGWRYRGHGLVQLTGKDNFRRFGQRIGVDLVAHPEKALDLGIAAKALIAGIEDGLYTGKAARDYLPAAGPAPRAAMQNARRIINGTFEAAKYAGYAMAFQGALEAAGYRPSRSVGWTSPGRPDTAPQRPAQPQVPPSAVNAPPRERGGFFAVLMAALASLFTRKPAKPQKLGPQGFVPVPHEGRTIWVMPDFYKRDGIRMPVTGIEALRIAQERSRAIGLPLTLPTKEMVDSIHRAADVRLVMPLRGEPRQSMGTYRSVDAEIERKLAGRAGLVSGHKKEILRPARAGRVTIYGGMKSDGTFWQPISSVHGETYTDYSHGLRLVYDPEE
jgi:putative chitinase